MKKHLRTFAIILSLIAVLIGFRFVAQASQGIGVIQNDGYAGSGGFLILLGGVVVGWLLGTSKSKK